MSDMLYQGQLQFCVKSRIQARGAYYLSQQRHRLGAERGRLVSVDGKEAGIQKAPVVRGRGTRQVTLLLCLSVECLTFSLWRNAGKNGKEREREELRQAVYVCGEKEPPRGRRCCSI